MRNAARGEKRGREDQSETRRDCMSCVLTVLGPCKDHEEHLEKQQWWCCPRAPQDVTSAQNIVPFPRSHWSPAPQLLRVRQHQQPREGSQHKSFLVPIAAPFSRHPSQGNLGGRGLWGCSEHRRRLVAPGGTPQKDHAVLLGLPEQHQGVPLPQPSLC